MSIPFHVMINMFGEDVRIYERKETIVDDKLENEVFEGQDDKVKCWVSEITGFTEVLWRVGPFQSGDSLACFQPEVTINPLDRVERADGSLWQVVNVVPRGFITKNYKEVLLRRVSL